MDEDTWNMDETGFRIGCGKAHWVISTHSHKPLLMKDPDNRDYITSVESSSGGGRDIPPMIILPGVKAKRNGPWKMIWMMTFFSPSVQLVIRMMISLLIG